MCCPCCIRHRVEFLDQALLWSSCGLGSFADRKGQVGVDYISESMEVLVVCR